MSRKPFSGDHRTVSLLLAAGTAALLPFATTAAEAQRATPLPPVTVEKPVKPKAKPKQPVASQPASEPAAAASDEAAAPAEQKGLAKPLTSTTISGEAIASKAPATSDTAALLSGTPGVSLYGGGGVSSLPVIQGFADDRIKILVNGAVISSACANHMNPALSYTSPTQVKNIDVFAGLTPVSVGGDSIGGTIVVDTATPQFASGDGVEAHGSLSAYWRSNGNGISLGGTASVATSNVAVSYSGSWSKADDYEDGKGNKVLSSFYEAQNHALSLAARRNGELFVLEGGIQSIPYQGFSNQWMDMTQNESWYINSRYEKQTEWGKLEVRANYRNVEHEMDKIKPDKVNTMPMNVEGVDAGYSVKAEVKLSQQDLLRVGNDFHHQGLNEWWPPVSGYAGMCCNTFVNINDATRDRVGTFAEWERKWTKEWTTQFGVRNDIVWMDTGDVVGYNTTNNNYKRDSTSFNSKDHSKTDVNFDMTALARYEPDAMQTYEAGYARKTRSASIYERYAWSYGGMASRMVSWFGDLNGYVGNLDLDPEVAHKLSFTAGWHDRAQKVWELKVTPYYSYVQDYITAERVSTQPSMGMSLGTKQLQFVNHDAELYGVDISGRLNLGEAGPFGRFALTGVIGYAHGDDLETGGALYHMMPWNAKFTLEHKLGAWTNAVELQLVADKIRVDDVRAEPVTDGYALVNLRSSYEWNNLRLDVGVENVLDTYYTSPLSGESFSTNLPVAGTGRTFYTGVTMKF